MAHAIQGHLWLLPSGPDQVQCMYAVPCMMCTGAINLSRIRTVYYGTQDPKGGCLETVIDLKKINRLNHYPNIVGNILRKECSEILTKYFRKKRELKKQKNKANIQ